MFELTPWQTYCFLGVTFFAVIGVTVVIRFIMDKIVFKKRRYHI